MNDAWRSTSVRGQERHHEDLTFQLDFEDWTILSGQEGKGHSRCWNKGMVLFINSNLLRSLCRSVLKVQVHLVHSANAFREEVASVQNQPSRLLPSLGFCLIILHYLVCCLVILKSFVCLFFII